jgi:hypothetical protein
MIEDPDGGEFIPVTLQKTSSPQGINGRECGLVGDGPPLEGRIQFQYPWQVSQ